MKENDLFEDIETSVLPDQLKEDALRAIKMDDIVLGERALKEGLVPHAIVAGSFDPVTHGHLYVLGEGSRLYPDAATVVVESLSKAVAYKLFPTVVRAALIRACGNHNRIILGDAKDEDKRRTVLTSIHRAAGKIIKGRRNQTDSDHTRSLSGKYQVEEGRFLEIPCPADLTEVSSGQVKGFATRIIQDPNKANGSAMYVRRAVQEVVLECTFRELKRRGDVRNDIFLKRLAAGSSESMFDV